MARLRVFPLGLVPFVLCVAIGLPVGAHGQSEAPAVSTPSQPEVLKNEDVIKMVKAGLDPGLIASKITISKTNFDLNTNSILALKHAGVSDYLLQVMQGMAAYQAAVSGNFNPGAGDIQQNPQLARWRGLAIDESTAEDAINVLGPPSKDKEPEWIDYFPVSLKFSMINDTRRKIHRVLTYKRIEGFDSVRLVFFKSRLVMIHLDLNRNIDPNRLGEEYGGVRFTPTDEWTDMAKREMEDAAGVVRRDRTGIAGSIADSLSSRGEEYYLHAQSNVSYCWAKVRRQNLLQGLLAKNDGLKRGNLPGWVTQIQLVSLSLKDTTSRDILR